MKENMNWKVKRMLVFFVLILCFVCAFPQSASAQTEQTQQTEQSGTAEEENMPAQQKTEAESETAAQQEAESETETATQQTEATTAQKSAEKENAAAKKKKTQVKKQPQATIRITKKSTSLEKGDTLRLRAKIKNSSTKKIIWKSSRKSVATVNKKGKVTAKKKGRTVITARISGTNIKAKCVIKVKNYITMRMRTTGYCNCRSCAGIWAGARTASGTRPKEKRTIAVDKRLIHLGTKVGIGKEMYVAEDTGGAIKGKRIDVYYASHAKAMAHGVKYQNVRVYY